MALFSVAEARAFDKEQLGGEASYPNAVIEAAESRIHEDFAIICERRFETTTVTARRFDGTGKRSLWLGVIKLQSVSVCVIYDSTGAIEETFDADDLADLAVYPEGKITRRANGWFGSGHRNVAVTFDHGYETTPAPIKRAALIVCVAELVTSDVGDRVTNMSDGEMTYNLSVPGRKGQWYGIPLVDSALARYGGKVKALIG